MWLKQLLIVVSTLTNFAISEEPFFIVSTTENPQNASTFQKELELETKIEDNKHKIAVILRSLEELNKTLDQKISETLSLITKLNEKKSHKLPKHCKEIMERGISTSGIYTIQPKSKAFTAFCDMNTKGGGWTVIHRRFDGSQDFYLNWTDYKDGFGTLDGEFWLGLENIYALTGYEVNQLFVGMVDQDEKNGYAFYDTFQIGSEEEGYVLKSLDGYEGNAGDSLSYSKDSKFSTKDRDQDSSTSNYSCAINEEGAWWYKFCSLSDLNGRYIKSYFAKHPENHGKGMTWRGFNKNNIISLLRATMMVRPK